LANNVGKFQYKLLYGSIDFHDYRVWWQYNLIWKLLIWKISQHNSRHPDSFYWKVLLQPTLKKFTAAFDFFKELITLQQNKIIWNKKKICWVLQVIYWNLIHTLFGCRILKSFSKIYPKSQNDYSKGIHKSLSLFLNV
jgi:hypothetical protein